MTVVVTVRLRAAAALPHRVGAVEIILPDETIGMKGTMIVTTATTTAKIAITTVVTETMTAGTVIANVLATVLAAPMTATAMPRMTGTGAKMTGSAATRSVRTFPMAKTGKVRQDLPCSWAATHDD